MATEIRAPGEVRQDAYATARVSPRIAAQVIARRARLGEEVRAGQALVTLSSVAMAEAQGELMVAEREWQRVRKLGKSVVSERRYTEARIAAQQARARVLAYGMSRAQVERLLRDGDVSRADGRFQLLSPIDGTVVADDFILGELVEPGRVLFEVTDEHRLWIEARLSPAQAAGIRVGAVARWETATEKGRGEVIQLHHRLDESTRTLGVRIGLVNEDHRLHPGQFVQVYLSTAEAGMALSVPEAALQRSMDGDWVVFVETAEGFEPKEVERLRDAGGRVVIGGLPEGTPVVVRGAFFLQSELAKSGFAVHNH
jgi:RND family efflux transporter MFP subunit